MSGCEDVKMRRCEDQTIRRCEDEKVWRCENVWQTPTIRRTLRSDALGKNWMSECRPDMIRMIENQKCLQCFFLWSLKSKIESQRRRNANFHSWVTRLPIEMNVHVANLFWRLLLIPACCLSAASKILTRAPSQPVALFFLADEFSNKAS